MNKKRIVRCKARIRDILREIREVNASHARLPTAGGEGEGDDDGVAADDIVCSKCGGGDADEDDENDILLCDLERCNRAYHQKCVDPPVSTADIPPGDESWFCAECECYLTALAIVNEEFETDADSPSELFPAVDRQRQSTSQAAEAGGVVGSGDGANTSRDQGSAHSTRGAAQEALLASDSDDSDFDPQEFKQVRRLHAILPCHAQQQGADRGDMGWVLRFQDFAKWRERQHELDEEGEAGAGSTSESEADVARSPRQLRKRTNGTTGAAAEGSGTPKSEAGKVSSDALPLCVLWAAVTLWWVVRRCDALDAGHPTSTTAR